VDDQEGDESCLSGIYVDVLSGWDADGTSLVGSSGGMVSAVLVG
jgi:hypothetical protein